MDDGPFLLVPCKWLRDEVTSIRDDVEAIRIAVGENQHQVMTKLNTMGHQMSEATDLLDQINTATNGVAARIADLVTQLQNSSDASPEVIQGLQNEVTLLQGLAVDPNAPVPAPTDGGAAPSDGSGSTPSARRKH